MANAVVICDPDAERRALFLKRIQPRLAPIEGLRTDSCSSGNFTAAWSAYEKAPVSYRTDEKGTAVVWGLPECERGIIDAASLCGLWNAPSRRYEAFDGYYAAAVLRPDGGIVMGADILGLFPLYYYITDQFLLAASSPELFKYHPSFTPRFNPLGFAGIALTNGLMNGQTLWKDVVRLSPGNVLVWQPGCHPVEQWQYRIPFSTDYYQYSFNEQLDLIDEALSASVKAQMKEIPAAGVLLSGGLDSRTVAAYLVRNTIRTEALTFGASTDVEMKCAKAAVKRLGITQRIYPVPEEEYPRFADLQVTWEHMANGFNNIWSWGSYLPLRLLPPRVAAGFILDDTLGGSYPKRVGYKVNSSTLFRQVTSWGLSQPTLAKLFKPVLFGDAVDQTIVSMEECYRRYADTEARRTLNYKLNHRQRFHIGGILWQMSFGSWPVLPVLNRTIMAIAGGVPPATLSERRAQEELLCQRFPHLASIPLDGNTPTPYILKPDLNYLLHRYVERRVSAMVAPVRKYFPSAPIERRHYYRIYNINGPGWKAVRRMAEPYRDGLADYFDMDVLRELLPGPDTPIALNDGIIDASGLKVLLGFMLWTGRQRRG